jgi:hypothetical protein
MAPLATQRPRIDETANLFDYVREHLADGESPYEQAWRELGRAHARRIGYPNTANFLVTTWRKQYSLLLCETDTSTVHELREWTDGLTDAERCVSKEIFAGDWRQRFSEGLPQSGEAILLSFDPYMVSRRRAANNPVAAHVYPEDLDCLSGVLDAVPDPLLIQISTYSANDGNSQEAVIDLLRSSLASSELEIVAVVRPLKKDLRDRNGPPYALKKSAPCSRVGWYLARESCTTWPSNTLLAEMACPRAWEHRRPVGRVQSRINRDGLTIRMRGRPNLLAHRTHHPPPQTKPPAHVIRCPSEPYVPYPRKSSAHERLRDRSHARPACP